MKKTAVFFLLFLSAYFHGYSQYFFDNFESYTSGAYLGPQSTPWTTWSNADGTSEDAYVVTTAAYSGTKSIYIESLWGGGPQDVVLDFGGVHSSGRFKFSSRFLIPNNKAAYFNLQGGASTGSIWALDVYFNSGFYSANSISGSYPQGSWFEFVVDCDLDNDVWEIFINGVSQGTFINTDNVSYLDLYPADPDSEFWVDDVSYCVNNACNPELAVNTVTVGTNPVCTHDDADVTVKVTNNGPIKAPSMTLGINVAGNLSSQVVNLNNLGVGRDTTFTIAGLFNSKTAGNNLTVSAINLDGDVTASNDTAYTTVTVLASPSEAAIIKGSPFTSPRPNTTGTDVDPDIVAEGDALTFEVKPPSGYSNSGYGTTWTMSPFVLVTSTGRVLGSTYYSSTAPGSGNATITVTPDTTLTDSVMILGFSVIDATTGCDSILWRYIYVAPRPKAGFNFNNVCDKVTMAFLNTSTIASGTVDYLWDFGDGTGSNLASPTHLYALPGSYIVKMYTTSSFGYVDSAIQTVIVYQLPSADFIVNNACHGDQVAFTDASTFPSGTPIYSWDFGDGNVSTQPNPNHGYAQPGVYEVKMTINVNGCESSKSRFATSAPRAVVNFSAPAGECHNEFIQFTNNTTVSFGTLGYTWDFGDGTFSSVENPLHRFTSFGSKTVKLIAQTDLGCVDSFSTGVSLIEAPVASFNIPSLLCEPTAMFVNTTTEPLNETVVYNWNFGNGNNSSQKDPVEVYTGVGKFDVTLIATASNGCTDMISKTITVDEKPLAAFVAEDVCEGQSVNFQNASVSAGTLTYYWDFDNGTNANTTNATVNYATAKTYQVKLFATSASGCTDTFIKAVIVKPIPSIVFTEVKSGLKGDGTIIFSATVPANSSYIWFFGDGNKEQGTTTTGTLNTVHIYTIDGNYDVNLIVTKDGCTNQNDSLATVFRLGTADINAQAIKVYPNPGNGMFYLDLNSITSAVASVDVFSANGQKVASLQAPALSEKLLQLDLENSAEGVYLVKVVAGESVYTSRIILTR